MGSFRFCGSFVTSAGNEQSVEVVVCELVRACFSVRRRAS
jgi:hypothetical protein